MDTYAHYFTCESPVSWVEWWISLAPRPLPWLEKCWGGGGGHGTSTYHLWKTLFVWFAGLLCVCFLICCFSCRFAAWSVIRQPDERNIHFIQSLCFVHPLCACKMALKLTAANYMKLSPWVFGTKSILVLILYLISYLSLYLRLFWHRKLVIVLFYSIYSVCHVCVHVYVCICVCVCTKLLVYTLTCVDPVV